LAIPLATLKHFWDQTPKVTADNHTDAHPLLGQPADRRKYRVAILRQMDRGDFVNSL
jgi:hypothetical protein